MRVALTIIICSLALTGCAHGSTSGAPQLTSSAGQGILGSLRPKADPAMIQHLREEAQAQQLKQQQELAAQQQKAGQQQGADSSIFGSRILPKVQTDFLAPPAEDMNSGPVISAADSTPSSGSAAFPAPQSSGNAFPSPTSIAMYNPPPPPGGGYAGGSLVPPPPAVTLTTNANMGGAIPSDSPYANAYMNPYGVPYPMPSQTAAPEGMSARPPGSLFSSGGGGGRGQSSGDDDSVQDKKRANFVPINPTGMDARSPYKQKDDLKILWGGAVRQSALQGVVRENRLGDQLGHVEIALPSEASKGSQGVSQKISDNLFKDGAVDKRAQPAVRKVQGDLSQAYYRYLHTFNLFVRAQQNVAARKQEVEVAGSPAEQQRAAADLSQAQSDVESSKDDMHSAQVDLAAVSGPEAARAVIAKVSGASPSLDSLSQGDSQIASGGSRAGGIGGLFSFGHKSSAPNKKEAPAAGNDQNQEDAALTKVAKADQKKSDSKEKKGKHGKSSKNDEKTADLAPAPQGGDDDAAPATAHSSESAHSSETAHGGGSADSEISFELKNVNVSARKSVLSVAIRNSGNNNFNFNPDVISISEGNHKLSEAAVRAEFDQNSVQPNQEVKGTITIFGRPYNERLAIVLSEGGKNIQLKR